MLRRRLCTVYSRQCIIITVIVIMGWLEKDHKYIYVCRMRAWFRKTSCGVLELSSYLRHIRRDKH